MSETTKRETRAEKQARTRAELIATAAGVFARRGYEGASVEEIAEQAGYSHGAVYSNFAGKSDLFLAVFEQYMADRAQELAATQAGIDDEAPLETRARALADQWMERFAADRESFLLHLEFLAASRREPELAKRFGTRSAALRETIAAFIAHHQEEEGAEVPLPPPSWRWSCGRWGSASRSKRWSAPTPCATTSTATSSSCWSRCCASGPRDEPRRLRRDRRQLHRLPARRPAHRGEDLGSAGGRTQRRQRRRRHRLLRARRPRGDRGRALAADDRQAARGRGTRAVKASPRHSRSRTGASTQRWASFTIHHWSDLDAGLAEMRRVARKRIVLLTIDAEKNAEIWTLAEYFPAAMAAEREKMPSMRAAGSQAPAGDDRRVPDAKPLPGRIHQRPLGPARALPRARNPARQLALAPATRGGDPGADRTTCALTSRAVDWDEKHGHLRTLPELDIGLRLICEEL